MIYKKDGKYHATIPVPGTGRTFMPSLAHPQVPSSAKIVGDYHTHGDYSTFNNITTQDKIVRTSKEMDYFNSDEFSQSDNKITRMATDKYSNHRSYLGTPSGKFKVYTVEKGVEIIND